MRLTLLAALLVSVAADVAAAQPIVTRAVPPQVVAGQYIVELQDGAPVDAVLRRYRLEPRARWRIVNGFAARMSDGTARRLMVDPLVKSVAPDLVVEASPRPAPRRVPDAMAVCALGTVAAAVPGVKVAVIDRGIDD
jgi:hypothetical protein